jgi:hypothetical protein
MTDMSAVIMPRSDQLNSDSLLVGPLTITISAVSIKPCTEQPLTINYDGDDGKPWKPCKSMARVLVHCWGRDANQYIGRSLTLYCDPKVTWGGLAVGGIRISHMSHITGIVTVALTATKGNKKPFVIKPLVIEAPKAAASPPAKPAEDIGALTAGAQHAASGGMATYQAFWKSLGKGAREALLPQHETFKASAMRADEQEEAPDEDVPVGDEMEAE